MYRAALAGGSRLIITESGDAEVPSSQRVT